MEKKSTDDLKNELMQQPDLDSYLSENSGEFSHEGTADRLSALCREKHLSKAELARRAEVSEVYLHQVLSGRRSPSRDRMLCLCVGLGLSLDETQLLLKQTSYAQLYPREKRDAIICHGLVHGTELRTINEALFTRNEKTLY